MDAYIQSIYFIVILLLIFILLDLTKYCIFRFFNKSAYIEYYMVISDMKNGRIPTDHYNFILYNQHLKYIYVNSEKTFSVTVDNNNRRITSSYKISSPYEKNTLGKVILIY